jgi:hypothetical protein
MLDQAWLEIRSVLLADKAFLFINVSALQLPPIEPHRRQ